MILHVYTVWDKAVGAFLPPIYFRSPMEAIRTWTETVNSGDGNFKKYPLDYTLCKLGEFDDANGEFNCADPVRVLSAAECMAGDRVAADHVKPGAVGAGVAADVSQASSATIGQLREAFAVQRMREEHGLDGGNNGYSAPFKIG